MSDIKRRIVLETAQDYEQLSYELLSLMRALEYVAAAQDRGAPTPQTHTLCTLIATAHLYASALHHHVFLELARAMERGASHA
jgi:hypothetical protein